ncbi:hypothetical protein [Prochlorothrix hollandica]|uniref:hypothetical protein n=1 Tax=Prochlorothrix hollandica TaxID=1223 RepID=UPI0011D252D2|nr:hypothetical protein [Prochlorothrix hollandica]
MVCYPQSIPSLHPHWTPAHWTPGLGRSWVGIALLSGGLLSGGQAAIAQPLNTTLPFGQPLPGALPSILPVSVPALPPGSEDAAFSVPPAFTTYGSPSSASVSPVLQGTRYVVSVNGFSDLLLQQVRRIEPGAFRRDLDGQRSIQAGVFLAESNAQAQVNLLAFQGIGAAVQTLDGPLPVGSGPSLGSPAPRFPSAALPSTGFPGGVLPNAGFPSGALPNAGFPGGALPNVGFPGGALPNVGFPGGALPNVGFPGGALPNAGFPNVPIPGVGFPAAALPDASFPSAALPSAALPSAALPSAALPSGFNGALPPATPFPAFPATGFPANGFPATGFPANGFSAPIATDPVANSSVPAAPFLNPASPSNSQPFTIPYGSPPPASGMPAFGPGSGVPIKSYYIAIPSAPESMPEIASLVMQSGLSNSSLQPRSSRLGTFLAVGPFPSRNQATVAEASLHNAGLKNARVYYDY